jgi:hypothetical protein
MARSKKSHSRSDRPATFRRLEIVSNCSKNPRLLTSTAGGIPMKAVIRTLAAVLAGLLVLFILVGAVELFSAVVHPLPEDFGGTTEEMCQHVERYPLWVLAVVVPAWAVAAFVSTWTARRLGTSIPL